MINYFVDTKIKTENKPKLKERILNYFLDMFDIPVHVNKGKIIIDSSLKIHFTESVHLSSDKNIQITSGRTEDVNRPGYLYSVWLNSDVDQNDQPLQTLKLINELDGKIWDWTINFDKDGKVILPDGWKIFGDNQMFSEGKF